MDEMTLVAELADVAEPDEARLRTARATLLDATIASGTRRRRAGRVLAAAAAFVAVGGGTVLAGVALSGGSPSTNTTIECGADTYIPTESGNPISDCRAALARDGQPVPPLVGWITPTGLVAVLPSGVAPPAGSSALPAGFEVRTAVRYVTDALGDQTGPLLAGCLSPTAATAYSLAQLKLAGLVGWHVTVQGATGGSGCTAYAAVVDAPSSAVTLSASIVTAAAGLSDPASRLDEQLRSQLGSGCDTAGEAVSLAASDAQRLGIAASTMAVTSAGGVGGGTRCAAAFVEPGGDVDVVIWSVGSAT